jgi:cysteinyl-tRNA synthetase
VTPVRLYDSFRREKVPFEPIEPGKVGMYLCGPTPYAAAHIGHAYSAIAFDTIRRSLRFLGYQVRFVRNITDVEDKIIKRANELHEDPMALAARYAADYNRDMARFGVLPPDVEPKVSTHIAEIIRLIERLVANGSAYQVDGDVYFEIATFPAYGALSGMKLEELRAGERVEIDARKRSPDDFALWKAAKPGEPSWDSPWGKGRPGWHIECSAMTVTHLGETFDLHGGGKDLIFPHHENEIAQSRGAFGGKTFARYWLHNGFLNFKGEKMSKSLGNVVDCSEIADAVGGEALRLFCVSHHFRSPVDFDFQTIRDADQQVIGARFYSLEAADRTLEYFYLTLKRIDDFLMSGGEVGPGPVVPEAEKLVPDARAALADDFNTPVVMAALHEAAALANRLLDDGKGVDKRSGAAAGGAPDGSAGGAGGLPRKIDKQLRRRTLARLAHDLRSVGDALGVFADAPKAYLAQRRARLVKRRGIDVASVERLLGERAAARAAKDFTRSDTIRAELGAVGVAVADTPHGTDWSVHDDAA